MEKTGKAKIMKQKIKKEQREENVNRKSKKQVSCHVEFVCILLKEAAECSSQRVGARHCVLHMSYREPLEVHFKSLLKQV